MDFSTAAACFCAWPGKRTRSTSSIFVRPDGDAYAHWRVATSLPELKAQRYGFGSYAADDYDALIDHPVEMGDFCACEFQGARRAARYRHQRPGAEPGPGASGRTI